MFHKELKAIVPREILECSAVSREINFTSQEKILQFRLEQRVFLSGACIEGINDPMIDVGVSTVSATSTSDVQCVNTCKYDLARDLTMCALNVA